MSKKTKLNISFILDETGSMMAHKGQTISGFNEYIKTLRNDENSKGARFTLTKFNSKKIEIIQDSVKLKDIKLLTSDSYLPADTTPLYDAIGQTIKRLEAGLQEKKKKQSVLVVIQTDGEENASHEYTREMIFKLREQKEKEGWTFVFLGADIDAYAAGADLGISQGNIKQYAIQDSTEMFRTMGEATLGYTGSGGTQTTSFFEPAGQLRALTPEPQDPNWVLGDDGDNKPKKVINNQKYEPDIETAE